MKHFLQHENKTFESRHKFVIPYDLLRRNIYAGNDITSSSVYVYVNFKVFETSHSSILTTATNLFRVGPPWMWTNCMRELLVFQIYIFLWPALQQACRRLWDHVLIATRCNSTQTYIFFCPDHAMDIERFNALQSVLIHFTSHWKHCRVTNNVHGNRLEE